MLLGDSGYSLKTYLMTPYLNPTEAHMQRYNTAHCRTRVLIEQTFGILKRRFSCLHSELRLSPQRACVAVVACCVLHNIGINRGDIISNSDDNDLNVAEDVIDGVVDMGGNGKTVRDHIARNYFWITRQLMTLHLLILVIHFFFIKSNYTFQNW